MENYCIPQNYTHRLDNSFFDDTPFTDQYQDEVYLDASQYSCRTVLDIGTGSGFKLVKYFGTPDIETTGVDIEPTLTFLKGKYPDRKWCLLDELDPNEEFDLIICSDVIEHIPDPTAFIKRINEINFKTIIFSTPDRLAMYGYNHPGPPSNPAHVREWSMDELNSYLGNFYVVSKHYRNPNSNTQIAVCVKK